MVVLDSSLAREKSDFENEKFVTSLFLDVIVEPSYKTKTGISPTCLKLPLFA